VILVASFVINPGPPADYTITQLRDFAIQHHNGIASETEAAKRLLEEALPLHDTVNDVIYRFNKLVRARQDRLQSAKEVLVGHPLISWLNLEGGAFSYQIHGYEVKLLNDHSVHILDPNGKAVDYDDPDPPMSADEYPPKKPDWAR
jgi:hypothetical protein